MALNTTISLKERATQCLGLSAQLAHRQGMVESGGHLGRGIGLNIGQRPLDLAGLQGLPGAGDDRALGAVAVG